MTNMPQAYAAPHAELHDEQVREQVQRQALPRSLPNQELVKSQSVLRGCKGIRLWKVDKLEFVC